MLGWLSQVLACPICGNHYTSDNTKVIESKAEKRGEEASLVIHSDCEKCKSSIAFNVAALGNEMFTVGAISDLTASDAIKFRKSNTISTDDILDLHTFLETFDGDFERALSRY